MSEKQHGVCNCRQKNNQKNLMSGRIKQVDVL